MDNRSGHPSPSGSVPMMEKYPSTVLQVHLPLASVLTV